ncbi:hypothetical protein L596_020934 [Steinernema carpocapsae]|uniref:7TM GPCR serpentine receptor class x (Srx) domain-containing protein n=1 Tax=Steinernema carpocapsae TaxID=34508 RepID=A0A4U5MV70_STECR|nr:hypothetical protein L596_020934 [Steinernema carpocapsae]
MHSIVSLNRCIAVYSTLKYKLIFTNRNCAIVIVSLWIAVICSASFLLVFPCNAIGYSPRDYEYIFVKCKADLWRDFSIVDLSAKRDDDNGGDNYCPGKQSQPQRIKSAPNLRI